MEAHTKRITASYLTNCSPEQAYQWLSDNSLSGDEATSETSIECLLLRRNDPLIDLGLARYGYSERALRTVFARGDAGVRCAVLSNPVLCRSFLDGDNAVVELKKLINKSHRSELQALALNQYLPDYVFEKIIKREGVFEALSEKDYMSVLINLGQNKRLCTPYDRTILDGLSDSMYHCVFEAAWELSKTLPAKEHWAYVLSQLLGNTHPVNLEGLDDVISRWRIDRPKKADGKSYFPGYGFILRSRLADLLDADEKLLNSDDLALRKSFYRRFHPWEFKEWPTFLKKDGEEFLTEAISHNMELWQSKEERKRLEDAAWACPDPTSDMMMPNNFREMEKELRQRHPDWFHDEDDEYSVDTDAIIRRLESKLNVLSDHVQSVVATKSSQPLVHAMPRNSNSRWLWLVSGLFAGLLMAALF